MNHVEIDHTRSGQIIGAALVPAPKQRIDLGKRALIEQQAMLAEWKPAKRYQKDRDASWTKKHIKCQLGYKRSINVDKGYKLIRKLATATAKLAASRHFEAVFDQATPVETYTPIVAIQVRIGGEANRPITAIISSARSRAATTRCQNTSTGVIAGSLRPMRGASAGLAR